MKKFVFIGNHYSGKTSIIKHYILDRPVNDNDKAQPTIGAAYHEVTKYSTSTKAAIWDTAGQERYKNLAPIYYRGCQGCVCVFDVTDQSSFDACNDWMELFRKYCGCDDRDILLIANKTDLDTNLWKVTDGEIRVLCDLHLCKFLYTSCMTLMNKNAFDNIFAGMVSNTKETNLHTSALALDTRDKEKDECSC